MSEPTVDRPPPDNPPDPNTRIREFLKQYNEQHPLNAPESDDEETAREQANQSPPPNCSICLGRVKSKCFTDSCMHQFCFNCLLQWSKVKPECPLCKQTFKSIIHNVTSMDQYDKYKVDPPTHAVDWQTFQSDMNLLFASLPTAYHFDSGIALRISRTDDVVRRRVHQLFRREAPEILRFSQQHENDTIPLRTNGVQWRNYVYLRQLYAEPLSDTNGHLRDISAEFFRSNPAQMHRLTPWLHRELVCVCVESVHPISFITQSIQQLLKTHDMISDEFKSNIRSLIPFSNNVDHFIHELTNFARSPFDMVGYDRYVTYLPRFPQDENTEVYSVSSSEENSDVEWVGPMYHLPSTETISDTAENLTTNRNNNPGPSTSATIVDPNVPSTSGLSSSQNQTTTDTRTTLYSSDSDEEEIRTYLRDISNRKIDEYLHNARERLATGDRTNDNGDLMEPIAYESSEHSDIDVDVPNKDSERNIKTEIEPEQQQQQQRQEDDTMSNDSDECMFVCAKKPPHLRTPEYVELNSDSDSDVVFVSSQPPMPTLDLLQSNDESSEAGSADTPRPSTSTKKSPANRTSSKRKRSATKTHSKRKKANEETVEEEWTICSKQVQNRNGDEDEPHPECSSSSQPQSLPPKKRPEVFVLQMKKLLRSRSHKSSSEHSSGESSASHRTPTPLPSNFYSSDNESSHEEYGQPKSRSKGVRKPRVKVQLTRTQRNRRQTALDRATTPSDNSSTEGEQDNQSDDQSNSDANGNDNNDSEYDS